jgi:hypothetical protein
MSVAGGRINTENTEDAEEKNRLKISNLKFQIFFFFLRALCVEICPPFETAYRPFPY